MKKTRLKSRLLRGVLGLGLLGAVAAGVTAWRAERKLDAPYPELHAQRDPALIERGRYLVEGPAHCGECHGSVDAHGAARRGTPLAGGHAFKLPVGTFYVPNITPDAETGIGRYS